MTSKNHKISLVTSIIAFGLIGRLIVNFALAANGTNSIEPETNTISGNASIISDATASNGSAVLFQACLPGQTGVQPNCIVSASTLSLSLISKDMPRVTSLGVINPMDPFNGLSEEFVSNGVPAWLAYDLSNIASSKRQNILVSLYSSKTYPYFLIDNTLINLPVNFTVETNTAPGGTVPTTGWIVIKSITGNFVNAPQVLGNMSGANWVRVNVQNSSTSSSVVVSVDIYSAPQGADDDWLLMGDSITHMATHVGNVKTLASYVTAIKPNRTPAILAAAIGGTSTSSATSIIDATIANFPGRYVVLAYGTNDNPSNFKMETLIQKVLASGKIPVIPHMPWSSVDPSNGIAINNLIDSLYTKYPSIIRGPDLYAAFKDKSELFRPNDVHPNDAGLDYLRHQWAITIAGVE